MHAAGAGPLSPCCLPLFALPERRGGMQNFIPPLVSSERKGTPHGRWSWRSRVFINPLPLPPQGFRTTTTPAHSACSLFQVSTASTAVPVPVPAPHSTVGTEESGHPDRYSQARSSKKREVAAIATRMMMDRQQLVRQCDMEVMKMAMLKHEETFRQQVHELHRLYRIQRELMSDLTRDATVLTATTRRRSKQPRRALDLQLPADEYIVSADEDEDAAGGGTELELTLAIGGGRRKNHRRRQRDNAGSGGCSPFGSDCSGASVLSSSPPSSAEYYSDDGPAPVAAFHAPPPPCQRAVAYDLGEGMMMRPHAPWLLQCQQYLSLRMT